MVMKQAKFMVPLVGPICWVWILEQTFHGWMEGHIGCQVDRL
jgi:hypothetical protein